MRSLAVGLMLAACGNHGGNAHDAGPTDGTAQQDAAIADAPGAPVTISITATGSGVMGVPVYFQNADSSLVAEQRTDATGSASATMAAGGYVTALVPQAEPSASGSFQQVQIETYAGVKPGDALVLTLPSVSPSTAVDYAVDYDNDVAGLGSGAGVTYEVFTTCNGENAQMLGGDATSLAVRNATANGGTVEPAACTNANVSVWAFTASIFQVATDAAVAITANTTLATVYAQPSAVSVSYTDVPADIDALFVEQALHTVIGTLPAPPTTPAMIPSGGSAAGMLLQTTLAGSKALTATMPDYGPGALGTQEILELGAVGAAYALDIGANALFELATAPTFTSASHGVSWTESATGVAPDLSVTTIDIDRVSTGGLATENAWVWQLAAPRNGTTATFPVLPTDIYNYNADGLGSAATDTVTVDDFQEFRLPGGYGAIRAFIFDNIDPATALGAAGKGSHEQYPPQSLLIGRVVRPGATWFKPVRVGRLCLLR